MDHSEAKGPHVTTNVRLLSVRALCATLATVLTIALLGAVPANAINNWGTVTSDIDGSANLVDRPQSAASDDGSVVITVFREFVSGKFQINYLIGTVDQNVQTWGTAGVVAVPPSGGYDRPYVAMSADGTKAIATWNYSSTIYSASATIAGRVATWGTAQSVSDGGTTKRLALSSDGTRAFSLALNGSSSIHANTATIDGTTQTWGTATAIGTTGRSVNSPVATLSSDGLRGVAMWTEKGSQPADPGNLASRAFTVSGSNATWGTLTPVTPVNTTGNSVSYPAGFASTDNSRVSAIWQKSDGATPANYEIQSASATVSGDSITWGAMTVLDSFTGTNVYSYPQMSGAWDGSRATATWMSDVNANTKLHANSVAVTGSSQGWGTKHTFEGAGSSTEYQTKLRVSADGRTAVVGLGRSSSPQSLLSATGQIEGNTADWGELSAISMGNASEILLTASANGLFATLVWAGSGGLLSMSGNTLLPPPTITSISPNSGPLAGGQIIKIKGDNLPLATSVTIGGLACTELSWDLMAGELSCLVPAGAVAGAVDVVVTTPTGSATSTGGYTYTGGVEPEPAIQVPNKPREVAVAGSPTSKKFRISWTEPTQTQDGRPVERYRATIVQKGPKKLILKKWVPSSKTKLTVSRKYLLKHSTIKAGKYAASGVRPRGDVVLNDLRYRIRIEAFNSLGGGPVATTHLRVRI